MAPVYTARHTSSSDRTTPLFALKGLKNLSPLPISQSGIQGVPLERQIAYTQYSSNLASFIHASVSNRKVTISNLAFGYLQTSRSLPLLNPPVHFTLQKELPHESSEKVLRMLGPGASKNKVGKTTIYQAPALPDETLQKILPLATSHFNAGREALNPMGRKALSFISTAFAEILRVHSYSAFSHESEESRLELSALLGGPNSYFPFAKDKTDPALRLPHSRHLQEVGIQLDQGDAMTDVGSKSLKEKLMESPGYFTSSGYDVVSVAKPPRIHAINVGPSSAVPQSPGILFPYFTGLLQPDSQSLTSFVLRHLFQLLGSTVQECQDTYALLRRGFNSLSTTDVGMELSHIGFGIDLALQTQGRCFVIIESNRYLGFTLLGARLAVFDSTKWVGCGTEADLRDDLSVIDPHQAAVRNLTSKFADLMGGQMYSGPAVTPELFSEPKSLVSVLKGLKLDQLGDHEEELNRNLRCLNYMGSGYVQRNPQTVAEMLETLFSDSVIELSRPTYIASVRSQLSTREYAVLSRFGPEAPSLWNDRGKEYQCVARESPALASGGKRKMGDLDTYANLPERLLVTPKPIEVAVRDLLRVEERGAVRMDLGERAGKNRNMSVDAESSRKRIWKVLVDGLKDATSKKQKVEVEKKNASAEGGFDDLLYDLLN